MRDINPLFATEDARSSTARSKISIPLMTTNSWTERHGYESSQTYLPTAPRCEEKEETLHDDTGYDIQNDRQNRVP